MAIEAPISKFKKSNIKIYIIICIIAAAWFGYDGYLNKGFIEKNTDENGVPNSTLKFNKKSPPFFVGAAVLWGVYFFKMRKRKLLAEENELVFSNNKKIPYDSIQKINKTHFEAKGYFIITYNKDGKEVDLKINDRMYDNLEEILNLLVAKIT
jgi:hypothetical protein